MLGGGFYSYSLGELRYEEGDSNRVLLRVFNGVLWGFTDILILLNLSQLKFMAMADSFTRISSDFLRSMHSVISICANFYILNFHWVFDQLTRLPSLRVQRGSANEI